MGLRPHDIEVAPIDGANVGGSVELVEALGAWATMHVRIGEEKELVWRRAPARRPAGVIVSVFDSGPIVAPVRRGDGTQFAGAVSGPAVDGP